jgi:hypothetical protein
MYQEIQLFTEKQLAECLNISIKKLQKDRQQNIGIKFVKMGKSVRYRASDVEEFLQSNTQNTLIRQHQNRPSYH